MTPCEDCGDRTGHPVYAEPYRIICPSCAEMRKDDAAGKDTPRRRVNVAGAAEARPGEVSHV